MKKRKGKFEFLTEEERNKKQQRELRMWLKIIVVLNAMTLIVGIVKKALGV